MATTIDKLTVDASVTGAEQFKALDDKLKNIEESSKKTATAMNQVQGGVRNTAYQIQDLAVQIAGGTSAFVALGQQLPQLLSGFGTTGVVIGAISAIAIPLLQVALKAAGIDMRNLNERLTALDQATKDLNAAQTANLPTIDGLRAKYGEVADEAKKYLDSVEKIDKIKAATQLSATLDEILSKFTVAGTDLETILETSQGISFEDAAMSASVLGQGVGFLALKTGLSASNAEILSDKLKNLNKDSKPEDVLKTVKDINEWLTESGLSASQILRVIENVVDPLNKGAQAALRMKENMAAASQASSEFNAVLTELQNKFLPNINDAKRNFDQITAIRKEGALKQAEFEEQVKQRTDKGEIVTAREIAATKLRISQDAADKEKDFLKGQEETAFTQQLMLEAKSSQLIVDGKIVDLQARQINGLDYQLTLEESVLKNINDQQQANDLIEQLLRKGNISRERASLLESIISKNRNLADENATKSLDLRIAQTQKQIDLEFSLSVNQQIASQKLFDLEKDSVYLSTIKIESLKQQYQLEAKRRDEAEKISKDSQLTDDQKLIKTFILNDAFNEQLKIIKDTEKFRNEQQQNFGQGSVQRLKELQESFSNFKTAGMAVDAVWNGMSSAIDKFVETGKLSFGDFARSIIMDLEKIALKSAVIGVFRASGLTDLFSLPGKATGGAVNAGNPYVVGEKGPEVFVPSSAGNIVPNNQLGSKASTGGGTTIINNISAIDSRSVQQLFAEHRMVLFGNVEQARNELPMRSR